MRFLLHHEHHTCSEKPVTCVLQVRDKDGELDDWFESDGQRELRQIFQGQGQIHDVLRDLNKKIDEVRFAYNLRKFFFTVTTVQF